MIPQVDELHSLLVGGLHTPVTLTLQKATAGGQCYAVTVLRHNFHSFDRDSHEKERRRLRARSAAAEAIPGGLSGHSGEREARAVGADAWSTNGQGPGSKSALTGLARAGALGAFVGLEVTHEPPHRVVQVDDLVDSNFVRHDEPGYTNPVVDPGDRIIAIDSTMCEHVSVRHVHSAYDAM